jgi:hypothetical protein
LVCVVAFAIIASLYPESAQASLIFSEDFDSYPAGENLNGIGGWMGRWYWIGDITVSPDESVSSPHSARMSNDLACYENQLYHPLPYEPVISVSADIMGVPTGRGGCHNLDVMVRLFTIEGGDWGRTPIGIALHSGSSGYAPGAGPGLIAYADNEWTRLLPDSDYDELAGQWISVTMKLDMNEKQADFWVDGIHEATLPVDPAGPLYTEIAIDCGNGLGYVDNILVVPEPTTVLLLGMGGLILRRKR